jgi:hypothetical protein
MSRPPQVNLRLNPELIAQVRALTGPGALAVAVDEALQLWLAAKHAGPADAAAQPAPVPAVAAPVLEPPRPSLPAMQPPPNAYRPPGR